MSGPSANITLTPHDRGDGTWYVEILRPGIVCEHVGDFGSKASAQAWIREQEPAYPKLRSEHDWSKRRRGGSSA